MTAVRRLIWYIIIFIYIDSAAVVMTIIIIHCMSIIILLYTEIHVHSILESRKK